MLKVPSNNRDEKTVPEFSLYKRTILRGRIPLKLLSFPTAFVRADGFEELVPYEEPACDVLFLVCTNAVDIVKFAYDSHELVTLDTVPVPFKTRNAASLVVPSWKNAFALLVSCEDNILLVFEYSVLKKTLTPYRYLKFEHDVKDQLGVHLCVDPRGDFIFLGSLGERHFCISREFLVQPVRCSSVSFPPCETVCQDAVRVTSINLTTKLVRDATFYVENEKQDDTIAAILAILLVDCQQKRLYIYIYTCFDGNVVFHAGISLRDLTRENISLRNELISWNALDVLMEKNKLVVFGSDRILFASIDSQYLHYDTRSETVDKQSLEDYMKANSEIIRVQHPQNDIEEPNIIAFTSCCACLARRGLRYFVLFEDGSLVGLRQNFVENKEIFTPVLLSQDIPNKNIIFADKRYRCRNDDETHNFYFYAVSSTRGLLSFSLKWNTENQNSLLCCEKVNEILFPSPVLFVTEDKAMRKTQKGEMFASYSAAFGMDSHSGIWELYKRIPLQLVSHHEERWHEECIKIFCLPRNATDSFDSLVVISFLHSTRIMQYDINENCFVESNETNFEKGQSTVYCTCIEDENYLQVHKGGIRLSLGEKNRTMPSGNRTVVDWNLFPQLEILQATSEEKIVAVQWSQHHYQIYLLRVHISSRTIEVLHVVSFSCQISYLRLQLSAEDLRMWIGTYEGTLELYNLSTQIFCFSLDNLVLQLPQRHSPAPDVSSNMVTTRVESLICKNDRIFVGTRDGNLWILTLTDSRLEICYGKSLGTAPLQLFSWSAGRNGTGMLLGLCGTLLWWIYERDERFYFQRLCWDHIFDGDLESGSCVLSPFCGWSDYPTLFISTAKQLALVQVPRSDRPFDIWYSKIYHTSQMTMKIQKYFITCAEGSLVGEEENVNILVVRKAARTNFHSSYEVQAWTCDMNTMLAHLVLPSHTAVTSICVWKQFLLIGATEESILYNDIRIPNTKGRVVLLQLVRTRHQQEISCRFMVNCEFLLPGAVMVVTPLDEETLLISCNEHLLAFSMDPQKETLLEIARGETRGLILHIHVEYPLIFVGDRKDSVHAYYLDTCLREFVPVSQDEYRKLVTSLSVQPYREEEKEEGQLVFVGDREAMLHLLWCPCPRNAVPNLDSCHDTSLMTCLCSIPWEEIAVHLFSFPRHALVSEEDNNTPCDPSSILACGGDQLVVTSMDGTWSQIVFIQSAHAKLLWRLQQVIYAFFRWPEEHSHCLLDGDKLVWFLSSNYTSVLRDWGQFTAEETTQLRHLLYFLEDIVHS